MTKKNDDSAPPFKIGPDVRMVTTASTIITLLGACVYGTWTAATAFNKMERSIDVLTQKVDMLSVENSKQLLGVREELTLKIKNAWLAEEQYRWATQLRWEFRKSELTIPDPVDFRVKP